ncbi:MAG: toxin ParE1/3/4 [Gammaproteobacteria bacterium]|jgi:toxin ParE1/3/4
MGALNWTTESQRWLKDIFEYIEADNPVAASQVVSGIYTRAQILLNHPELGYRYQASSRHIRILLYGHYRIAYLVKEDGDIDILGVFHGSLDISRYSL